MVRILTALILTLPPSVAFAADLRFQKCAVDICGTGQLERYGGKLDEPSNESVEGFYSQNIEPLITEILEENRKHFFELVENSKIISEKPILRDLTFNADRGIIFQFFVAMLRKYPEILIEDDKGAIVVNDKKLDKALDKSDPAFREWFRNFLKTFTASSAIRARANLSEIGDLDQLLDSFKYDGEPEDQIETTAKFLEKGMEFGNYLGFKNLYAAFVLQKLKDNTPLTPTDAKQVVRALKDRLVTQAFFQEEKMADVLFASKVDTAAMFKALNLQPRLEKIASEMKDSRKWQLKVKRELEYCAKKILPAIRATMQDSEYEQALGAYSVWKAAADETLAEFLPPAEALALKAKFHSLRYVLPETREQLQTRMNTDFTQGLLQARMDTEMDREYKKLKHPEMTLANTLIFSHDRSVGVRSLCDVFELEPIVDNMASGYEKTYVTLGWRSFKFWDAGAGILGHELGHVVYKYAQKVSLQAAHSCRANKFVSITNQTKKIHEQYENEEFADLFGSAVQDKLMKMGYRNMQNGACVLIAEPTIEQTYASLNLVNQNKKDEHPASFYRVLRWQAELGRPLPQSCSGLASANVMRSFAQSCRSKN